MRRRGLLAAPLLLCGCVSVGIGEQAAAESQHALRDAGGSAMPRLTQPLVAALVLQPSPADALADSSAIAYSRHDGEFRFYRLASWTERPVRALPRLLQQRLEDRGVAAAVGLLGEPLHADWLLAVGIDTVHHDLREAPGAARLAVTLELFDRRRRVRVARRRFEADVPAARADSAAAAAAMSQAVARVFDAAVPWLEEELRRAPR